MPWFTTVLSHPKHIQPQKWPASPKAMLLCPFLCCWDYETSLWAESQTDLAKEEEEREKIIVQANSLEDRSVKKNPNPNNNNKKTSMKERRKMCGWRWRVILLQPSKLVWSAKANRKIPVLTKEHLIQTPPRLNRSRKSAGFPFKGTGAYADLTLALPVCV